MCFLGWNSIFYSIRATAVVIAGRENGSGIGSHVSQKSRSPIGERLFICSNLVAFRTAGRLPRQPGPMHSRAPRQSGACPASVSVRAPAWAGCARPGCRYTSGRCIRATRCSPKRCRSPLRAAGPRRRVC